MNFGTGRTKAWKDIWGAGQGIGAVRAVVPAAELVARLAGEYTPPAAGSAWRRCAPGRREAGVAEVVITRALLEAGGIDAMVARSGSGHAAAHGGGAGPVAAPDAGGAPAG